MSRTYINEVKMRLVIIGIQGSGKGTQAKILSKKLKIPHISVGDLLRNAKGKDKEIIDQYMVKGKLSPVSITLRLLKARLKEPDAKNGFILDGFPRNKEQTELLEKIIDIDKVIEIYIPERLSIQRLSSRLTCSKCGALYNKITNPPKKQNLCDKCGGILFKRKDDYLAAIKERIKIYKIEKKAILNKYKEKLIIIDGAKSIDAVNTDIIEKLRE
jgi:adenylate kinase